MKFGTIDCTVHHDLCSTVRFFFLTSLFLLSKKMLNLKLHVQVLKFKIWPSSLNKTEQKCSVFLSTTSRRTRPRSSSTAPRSTSTKGSTRPTASWSSYRCCSRGIGTQKPNSSATLTELTRFDVCRTWSVRRWRSWSRRPSPRRSQVRPPAASAGLHTRKLHVFVYRENTTMSNLKDIFPH